MSSNRQWDMSPTQTSQRQEFRVVKNFTHYPSVLKAPAFLLWKGAYLIQFQRFVQQDTSFFPVVSLVPNHHPDQLIIFFWFLVAQFNPQCTHMRAGHVIPEGHAVGRALGIDHRAHQAGYFAFLIFISLGIDEVAISCWGKTLCQEDEQNFYSSFLSLLSSTTQKHILLGWVPRYQAASGESRCNYWEPHRYRWPCSKRL